MFILKGGLKSSFIQDILVADGGFKKSIIKLTPKKEKLVKNTQQLQQEGRIIGKHFATISKDRVIRSAFVMPAEGTISSPFGAFRVYNGTPGWRHSGVDIANAEKSPVVAPNHGKVIFSDSLETHGGTVMIDHGLGVVSIYNHLHTRLVRVNDSVKQGQKIGLIGQTGIATGPHVHWGLSIQNVRVNPLYWVAHKSLHL